MNTRQRLFKPSVRPAPLQGRLQNGVNGSDAESFAMARVLLACRGEGQWGSREDDNAKVDLILSIQHPWSPGERMSVLAQVKSGATYGEVSGDGFKLKSAAKTAAKRTSHDICAIWVDRDNNKVFWAYIHTAASTSAQVYGQHHEVTPAMLFDLSRFLGRNASSPVGGKGIIIAAKPPSNFKSSRRTALDQYRSLSAIVSPTLGRIELTRIGWRHMFRRSRAAPNKGSSIDIIPYLRGILSQRPSSHSVMPIAREIMGGYEHRICEHLLKFDQVSVATKGTPNRRVTACIRLIEDIRYPENWRESAMLSQQVCRRLVLKSAYYK